MARFSTMHQGPPPMLTEAWHPPGDILRVTCQGVEGGLLQPRLTPPTFKAMWAWYFPSYLLKRTHSFTHTHTREVRPPPPPPAGKYFLDLRGRQKCLFLKN